jgi:hypothetical protein
MAAKVGRIDAVIARQRHGKHISAATYIVATIKDAVHALDRKATAVGS